MTHTDFLNGRVRAWQPVQGYRAGVDPVLLAASLPVQTGQSALELGCGVGVASLCLMARVPGVAVTGVELQADYAALAQRNGGEAGADFTVSIADLRALPADLRQRQFDHVFANPPYFQRDRSTAAQDAGRDIAFGGDTPLATWVEVAAKRCAPKGYVTFIQRIERLPELIMAMQPLLGSLEVQPLIPRAGREAQLVLIRGRKNGRADFRLHDGIVMHEGAEHLRDGEDYAPKIRAVLRDGAALPFGS
nr:methyltransferase domain-containing protein [Thalassobius sp. Cn5-15]